MIASALLLLPVFLLIALGAALKRVPAFDAAFWRGLEALVYFILFPALLFHALATSTMSFGRRRAARRRGHRVHRRGYGAFRARTAAAADCRSRRSPPASSARSDSTRTLRSPPRAALPDPKALRLSASWSACWCRIVNIAAVAMLAQHRGSGVWLAVARNPLVMACAAGLAGTPRRYRCRPYLGTMLDLLAGAALPLGLVAAGAGLEFVHGTLPLRAIVWWNAIKLAALPAIAFALAALVRAVAARTPGGRGARRRADRAFAVHSRDADERRRCAGRAADLDRNAAGDRDAAALARAGQLGQTIRHARTRWFADVSVGSGSGNRRRCRAAHCRWRRRASGPSGRAASPCGAN